MVHFRICTLNITATQVQTKVVSTSSHHRKFTKRLSVDTYVHGLHISINHALAVSYRRASNDDKASFVAHITLVKGIPFYGYSVGYKLFLKIYLLNPINMTRLADLLRQGAIMKQPIQPYESHMQYLLQWMCDFNLYGCAYIDCCKVKFRSPVPQFLDMSNKSHEWHDRTIGDSMISDENLIPRQSHCSIEVDICVQDILNRLETKPRYIHHDFIERTNPLSLDEKLVNSMADLWRDETRRRKARMGILEPGNSPFPPEVLISVSADPRNMQPGGWIHEAEYKEKIEHIVSTERTNGDGRTISYDNYVQKVPNEGRVKTAFESVEDLFPTNLSIIAASPSLPQETKDLANMHGEHEINVDENRILNFEAEDYQYESDEELARELEISQRERGEKNANSDISAAVLNYKSTSGADTNAAISQAPRDPTKEASGPSSSAELEALGIRNVGNYNHIDEDAFEVPPAYTSNITLATTHRKRVATLSEIENTSKRRKTVYNEISSSPNMDLDTISQGSNAQESAYVKSTEHTTIERFQKQNEISYPSIPSSAIRAGIPECSAIGINPSSQEVRKISGLTAKGTLSFPVVKDSRDSNSTHRLSQKSNFFSKSIFAKSSQTSKEKIVSSNSPEDSHSASSSNPMSLLSETSKGVITSSLRIAEGSTRIHHAFGIHHSNKILCLINRPPPSSEIPAMLQESRIPDVLYQDAYYSNERDVPERAREYAGKEFKLGSITVPYLPAFDPSGLSLATYGENTPFVVDKVLEEKRYQKQRRLCSLRAWEFGEAPPAAHEVQSWLDGECLTLDDAVDQQQTTEDYLSTRKERLSQIDGPTQKNRHGFKYSQKQDSTSVQHETQYMSLMSLEIHVNTQGNLVPNPEQDEIACAFWCLQSDDENVKANGSKDRTHVGILALSESEGLARKISLQTAVEVEEESTELDLINRLVDIVRNHDPDILTGFEVHGSSWGYVIERARYQYDYNLCDEFSRMKSQSHGRFGKENDRWGFNHTSTIRVTGRHMINIWRAMRGELNLLQYTMENIVFHVLHRRIPHFSYSSLTQWYSSPRPRDLAKVIDYYVSRVQLDLEILEQNELIPRTSEQARLLGVDFFSVFSRGSQFKVESLMFRIAKPENFILVSPSRKQVGQQNALECLPLVMEPQSAFFTSPLLVLDFQSLYPSVMIAYNYCYSTFLGRVVNWRGQNKMGFSDYKRENRLLELFKDQINIAPNGIMYVKPEIRKSLLAKMLGEILETRVMVKSGMKVDKDDKTLQRLLNNRQLALKLIANVTYGYTSASFSGRMPCSEIADSIVQTGRETLEKAIALIHSVGKWNAEVVYGDTDSLFVHLKGRTKDEAFDIGNEIAKTITDMNPRPVKLKFEKVYFPCVLLAKKRYVGFKYESKSQKEPEFDAKGIETVRRDGTPAEQKIEEKALKTLFRTADLSQVKAYFQQQCSKIMKGKVSIQDFCFAKEVKLGTYSDKGPPPPGALISTKRMLEDPRAEPQYGERVPYVVITGAPGARLIDRCVAPEVLLHNDHDELDAEYYILKNLIPPLERIFNLVGANVRQWYDEMPKFQRIRRVEAGALQSSKDSLLLKKTLESYMKASSCLVCRNKLEAEVPICNECTAHPESSLLALRSRLNVAEKKALNLERVCRSCARLPWGDSVKCDSKDCPVFYTRTRHVASLGIIRGLTDAATSLLQAQGSGIEW